MAFGQIKSIARAFGIANLQARMVIKNGGIGIIINRGIELIMDKRNMEALQIIVAIQRPMAIDNVIAALHCIIFKLIERQKAHTFIDDCEHAFKIKSWGDAHKKMLGPLA